MGKLDGKNVVITGAAGGMGQTAGSMRGAFVRLGADGGGRLLSVGMDRAIGVMGHHASSSGRVGVDGGTSNRGRHRVRS